MNHKQFLEMMEKEEYKGMTCGEFARIIRESDKVAETIIEGSKK